jgi:hypothetical protein
MASIDDVYGSSELLRAADLKGRKVTVTIASVTPRQFNDGGKLELSFVNKQKRLIANKTNGTAIAEALGSDYDRWPGSKIVLFPSTTDFKGERVPCVRCEAAPSGPRFVPEESQLPPAPAPRWEGGHGEANAAASDDIPF